MRTFQTLRKQYTPMAKSPEFDILTKIAEVKKQMQSIESCFDAIEDPDMLEYCVLELRALNAEYQALVRHAKSESFVCPYNDIIQIKEKKTG